MRKLELIQFSDIDLEDTTYCARLDFPDESIEELATSIKEHGLRNPPAYLRNGQRLSVLFGWRRTLAIGKIGWAEFESWVYSDLDTLDAHFHNLNDNLERENLTVLEVANKVKTMRDLEIPVEVIAKRTNNGTQRIYDLIRLTEMDPEMQRAVHNKEITLYKAIEIHKFPESKRLETLHQTIEDTLSIGMLKRKRKVLMDDEVSEVVEKNIQSIMESSASRGEEITREEAIATIRPVAPKATDRNVWSSHKGWVVDLPADWKDNQEDRLGKPIHHVDVEIMDNGDLLIQVSKRLDKAGS